MAFAFGIVALLILFAVALYTENPSPLLIMVSRVTLALACASVVAVLPGYIHLELSQRGAIALRAGGAIAIFVLVYLFNPASYVIQSGCNPPQAPNNKIMPVVNEWLKKVDAGNLDEAYETAAKSIRSDFRFEDFKSVFNNYLEPLGELNSRVLQGLESAQVLPSNECGNFRIFRFYTTFENGDDQIEIIILTVEDDRWVVRQHNFIPKPNS